MSQPYCCIHTRKHRLSKLECTFETFSCGVAAFGRMVELVEEENFAGAYLIDEDGECFDQYLKVY